MGKRHLVKITNTEDEVTFTFYGGDRAFIEHLKTFKDESRAWIELSPYVRTRTHEQNSFMHFYFQEISDETGMELDEVKDALKYKFLRTPILDHEGNEMADENGEVMFRVKETKELSTVEMMIFIDKIKLMALELWNMVLPEANRNREIKYK